MMWARASLSLLVGACSIALNAASFTTGNGELFEYNGWSRPQSFFLKAPSNRLIAATRQSCTATNRANEYKIDLIHAPALKALWIGSGYEDFFVSGERICGIRVYGTQLRIKQSGSTVEADRVDERASIALRDLFERYENLWGGDATAMFRMEYVFGHRELNPSLDARGSGSLKIISVIFEGVTSKISVQSIPFNSTTNHFAVSLSPDFDLISAAINGRSFPVFHDGRIPQRSPSKWAPVRTIQIVSVDGLVSAFSFGPTIYGNSPHQFTNRFGNFNMRAVVLTNGSVWIGPEMCWLVVNKNEITGLIVDRTTKELKIHKGPRAVISLTDHTTKLFQAQLVRFEAELDSGAFKEAAAINIPDLFPDDRTLLNDPDIAVADLFFRNNKLVAVIRTNSPQRDIEITFSGDRVETALRIAPRRRVHSPPWSWR